MSATPRSPTLQQAIARHRAGDLGTAAQLYRQLIDADPDNAEAYQLLGVLAQQMGKPDLALQLLETAIQLQPRHAAALANLSILLRARGDNAAALAKAEAAVAADPTLAAAQAALGGARAAQQDYAAAVGAYRAALRQAPDNHLLHNDLANTLRRLGQLPDAYATITRALTLAPHTALLHHTRGNILRSAGYADYAQAAFDAAHRLDPTQTESALNAALCCLLCGDYQNGWRRYAERAGPHPAGLTPWDGQAAVPLLVTAEQGLGDTLQFIRYAPMAQARVPRLVIAVQPPVLRLLQHSFPTLHFIASDTPLPNGLQAHCRLLDLPQWFSARCAPYLAAPYLAAPALSPLGAATRRPRFGLVWAGNPAHLNDANRSLPLAALAPAIAPFAAQGVSLQKGAQAAELAASGLPLMDGGALCNDFADTAALLQQLDVIITVDTSVAHLAGGLGKPVWLLLPFDPDWRWQHQRRDTPWYPLMKLYRQSQPQDWCMPLAQLGEDLARFMAGDASVLTPPEWQAAPASRAALPVVLPGLSLSDRSPFA